MFMNPQEQEEFEFNLGRQTSLQQCFAASRQDWQADPERANRAKRLKDLLDAGRFVAVVEYPVYCPSTDAIMGSEKSIVGDFATREEAEDALNGRDFDEERAYVLPYAPIPLPPLPVVAYSDEDIPF